MDPYDFFQASKSAADDNNNGALNTMIVGGGALAAGAAGMHLYNQHKLNQAPPAPAPGGRITNFVQRVRQNAPQVMAGVAGGAAMATAAAPHLQAAGAAVNAVAPGLSASAQPAVNAIKGKFSAARSKYVRARNAYQGNLNAQKAGPVDPQQALRDRLPGHVGYGQEFSSQGHVNARESAIDSVEGKMRARRAGADLGRQATAIKSQFTLGAGLKNLGGLFKRAAEEGEKFAMDELPYMLVAACEDAGCDFSKRAHLDILEREIDMLDAVAIRDWQKAPLWEKAAAEDQMGAYFEGSNEVKCLVVALQKTAAAFEAASPEVTPDPKAEGAARAVAPVAGYPIYPEHFPEANLLQGNDADEQMARLDSYYTSQKRLRQVRGSAIGGITGSMAGLGAMQVAATHGRHLPGVQHWGPALPIAGALAGMYAGRVAAE